MLQTGIVQALQCDGRATIEIARSTACGENCASCGLCSNKTILVSAVNDVGAAVGDTVEIDMADRKVLGAAFLVYIVPLIVLIAGYCAAYAVFKSELFAVVAGLLLMAFTFLVIRYIDKSLKEKYTPHIVRILQRPDGEIS